MSSEYLYNGLLLMLISISFVKQKGIYGQMKKTIIQAIIFSIIIHVLILGFPIAKGYLLTKFHNPSKVNAYGNVHMLQNEVAFGGVYDLDGVVLLSLSFLVGIGFFMIGKFVFVRLTAKGLKP